MEPPVELSRSLVHEVATTQDWEKVNVVLHANVPYSFPFSESIIGKIEH